MNCPACQAAMTRSSGIYRDGCKGCAARAIARSKAAFNALHDKGTGKTRELIELVDRLLPDLPTEAARKMVRDWWSLDHQQQGSLV